jgi:hypothetical protein
MLSMANHQLLLCAALCRTRHITAGNYENGIVLPTPRDYNSPSAVRRQVEAVFARLWQARVDGGGRSPLKAKGGDVDTTARRREHSESTTPGEHVEAQLAACTSTGEQHERQMSRAQSSDPNNPNKQTNALFTVQGDRRTTLQHEPQPPGLSDGNTAVDSMFDESEERDAVVGHVGPFDDASFDTTWQYGVVVTNWASLNTCDVALPGCSQVRVSPALVLVCGSRRDFFTSWTTFFCYQQDVYFCFVFSFELDHDYSTNQ